MKILCCIENIPFIRIFAADAPFILLRLGITNKFVLHSDSAYIGGVQLIPGPESVFTPARR